MSDMPSAQWERCETAVDRNGTALAVGDKVKPLNGKNLPDFVFRCLVKSDKGEWIEVFGRNNQAEPAIRSFPVDKIERLPQRDQPKPRSDR